MRRSVPAPFLLSALLCAWLMGLAELAWAQAEPVSKIYTCRDASGRMITSDRPIPECADRSQKELGKTGQVIKEVLPPMSIKEELRYEEEQEAKRREIRRLQDIARRDRALQVYKNEADLQDTRQRALAFPEEQIKGSEKRILLADKEIKEIDEIVASKGPNGAPPTLRRRRYELDAVLETEKIYIADRKEEIKRINARFDDELVRYRKLMAQSK